MAGASFQMLAGDSTLPSVSYIGKASGSVGTGSSITFAATAIGTASNARTVIVGVAMADSDPGLTDFSSVTVGGATANLAVKTQDGTGFAIAGIYSVNVASGTTADIVVNLTATLGSDQPITIFVWAAYSLASATATATNHTASSSNLAANVNVSAGGFIFATSQCGDSTARTYTGVTKDDETGVNVREAGHATFTSASTPASVSINNANTSSALVTASFR